jgi:hypothetical protein
MTENTKPHINLIIATPGHSMMSSYVRSLLATTQELTARGITWAFSSEYSSHVADAREITLNGDNQNDPGEQRPFKGQVTYDKIMWIDSDIAWNPEDVIRLYESDKEIVTGAYLLASGESPIYDEIFGPAYTYDKILEMKEPVKIAAAGFGFIMVSQGIFEQLTRPWFQSPMYTKTMGDGRTFTFPILGEDLSWCKRVTDLGYDIWFDPKVKVLHHKMMKLTWEGVRP